ncbi:hypothetical protein [Roseivivax sediminis]|uniref:Uncharacterized protein n=1 Tax=Roseivivax sediminis TaxID=936889 RepID=A0A1I2E5S8_9RHOB|nr:hypothetical protein [Roseivivax sediminis]SFE87841.1 hypothetical protein SAMN04515678_12052 [Roseivivax sediminis]
MAKTKPVRRVSYAAKNQSELSAVKSRQESARAYISSEAGRDEKAAAQNAEPTKTSEAAESQAPAVNRKPKRQGSTEVAQTPEAETKPEAVENPGPSRRGAQRATELGPKKKRNGLVQWLPAERAQLQAVADRLEVPWQDVEKALLKNARDRFNGMTVQQAETLGSESKHQLDATKGEGASGIRANAFASEAVFAAIRTGMNDRLNLISDYRIVSAVFRHLALEALKEWEKEAAS